MRPISAKDIQTSGLAWDSFRIIYPFPIRGLLRGLHYQLQKPQGKLVMALQGEIVDVVVDIRQGSPYFGKWVKHLLSADNHHQLYVPPGFAHGFAVLSDTAIVLYKVSDYYNPGDEYGITWNDPGLAIDSACVHWVAL